MVSQVEQLQLDTDAQNTATTSEIEKLKVSFPHTAAPVFLVESSTRLTTPPPPPPLRLPKEAFLTSPFQPPSHLLHKGIHDPLLQILHGVAE